MWADPVVVRHIGGRPFTAQETWTKILRYVGHWQLLGFGYWVLCERATGRFVGEAGFADFRREMTPPLDGTPELGWALATWAHGRGLATEALRAMLAWGDSHLAARRTVCIINPDNRASIRVAEKIGYREKVKTRYGNDAVLLFER